MSKIWIFSRPIRSGKTTEILQTLAFFRRVDGILCPDKKGLRYGFAIADQRYFPLQIEDETSEPSTSIGRFHFSKEGFHECQNILGTCRNKELDWIIVDEIGKLEYLRNEGLEPELSSLIHHHKMNTSQTQLLLVVRDFLLDEIIAHYGLQEAEIIHDLTQWTKANQ